MQIINYNYTGKDFYIHLAIDLFSFSYFMGGINFIDMAYLTHDNIMDTRLVYKRKKTRKLIKLPLLPKAIEINIKQRILIFFSQSYQHFIKQKYNKGIGFTKQ